MLSWLPKRPAPPTAPTALVWAPASSEWLESFVSASPGLKAVGDMGKSSSVLLSSRYKLGVAVSLRWEEASPLLGPLDTLPQSFSAGSVERVAVGGSIWEGGSEVEGEVLLGPAPAAEPWFRVICWRESLSCCWRTRMVLFCLNSAQSHSGHEDYLAGVI